MRLDVVVIENVENAVQVQAQHIVQIHDELLAVSRKSYKSSRSTGGNLHDRKLLVFALKNSNGQENTFIAEVREFRRLAQHQLRQCRADFFTKELADIALLLRGQLSFINHLYVMAAQFLL